MNTEETYWNKELEEKFSILEVHHLKKQEFDHGATRCMGSWNFQMRMLWYL